MDYSWQSARLLMDEQTKLAITRHACETDHLFFTRYFFFKRFKIKFIVKPYHYIVCQAIDDIINGKIKRLIINIPPRYSKTEFAVINLIARGLAINPMSNFIHTSYSGELAWDNSELAKEIVLSEEYKKLWPRKIKRAVSGKKHW